MDASDTMIYVNQYYAETLLSTSPNSLMGKTFNEIVREAFRESRGLNIETDDIELWIKTANSKRWQQRFRSFEVDLLDGRWFLITEQVIGGQFLFIHTTEITHTKTLEKELLSTQSKLMEQAYIDELTNIPNRRAFVERTTKEINRAHRNKSCICLFLFDVDYFKKINDVYGHLAGDQVLKSLCDRVQSEVRDYDIFARIGGEEFAMVFTDGEEKNNLEAVERIRTLINATKFQFDNTSIGCSVSFGGVTLKPDEKLESLVSRADKNLYQAKRDGRNRTIFEN